MFHGFKYSSVFLSPISSIKPSTVADIKRRKTEYHLLNFEGRASSDSSSSPIVNEIMNPTNIQQVTGETSDSYNHQSIKKL